MAASRSVTSGRAGALTTLGTILNVLVGLVVQSIIAANFGLGELADTFQVVSATITFAAVVSLTLAQSYLVPLAASESNVWSATRPLLLTSLVASVGLAIWALMGGSSARSLATLGASPSAMLAGLAAPLTAIAIASRRFLLAAMSPVANGLGLLVVLLFLGSDPAPLGLGAAISVGYLTQLLVLSLALFDRDEPGRPMTGAIPPIKVFFGLLTFTAIAKLQPLVERYFAELTGTGVAASLGFGQKIAQGIQMIGSFGLAVAISGAVASSLLRGDDRTAGATVARTVVAALVIATSACACAGPSIYTAVHVVFPALSPNEADQVSAVVIAQIPWILFTSLAAVVTAALYGQGIYRPVVLSSLAGIVALTIGWLILRDLVGSVSVALASSFGAAASLLSSSVLVLRTPIGPHLRPALATYRGLLLLTMGNLVIAGTLTLAIWRDPFVVRTAASALLLAVQLGLLAIPWYRRSIRSVLTAHV